MTTLKTLVTKVDTFATEAGKELKKTRDQIGDITTLKTANKTNVVVAINELKDTFVAASEGAFDLQDAKDGLLKDTTKGADTTYSSTKIEELVSAKVNEAKATVKAEILGGAEAAYDTLKELQDKLKEGATQDQSILDALGNRLRIDQAMDLTEEQQGFLAQTLGIPTDIDFVAKFNAALNA